MTLDARYTVRTHDDPPSYIFIRAHGLYRPGPGTPYASSVATDPNIPPPETATQDDVEFFSHLRLEAGPGKYNWVNGLVCVGVMCCVGTRIVIDVYYLTNFLGREPEDVVVVKHGAGAGVGKAEGEKAD